MTFVQVLLIILKVLGWTLLGVLGLVLLLVLFLLLMPIGADVEYIGGNLKVSAKVCGILIQLIPKKMREKHEKKPKKEKSEVRTGWTFGILPSIAYDADKGFQYGVLANVYDFGDGSAYPDYFHSLYFEAAYTTKRSGLFRFAYDSKHLLPGHHLKLDVSYLPDALCDL